MNKPQPVDTKNASLTILLADDDEDDQELLKDAFARIDASINFYLAGNGKQVLHCLESLPNSDLPCLIILDYNMPELTGAEVLEIIAKEKRYTDVPKLIWTTSNSFIHKQQCLSIGADDYFVKPDNVSDIEKMARRMLHYCKDNVGSK